MKNGTTVVSQEEVLKQKLYLREKGKKAYQCSDDFFSLPLVGLGWNGAKH